MSALKSVAIPWRGANTDCRAGRLSIAISARFTPAIVFGISA